MNTEILLLILGMTAVTYIPRAVPAVFIEKLKISSRTEKFLKLIPYTAMTALIFPGVFSTDPEHIYIGIIGAIAAAIPAWFKKPVLVCVLAAVGVNILLYLLI